MKTILRFITFFLLITHSVFGQLNQINKDQVIIKMQKDNSPEELLLNVHESFELKIEQCLSKHADIYLLNFNGLTTNKDEVISSLIKHPEILFAQPNRPVKLRATPNDPQFNNQWHHNLIQSELAWDITTGGTTDNGKEIVVALIESADLLNHDDLSGNHWKNLDEIPNNGIDDDGNGYIDDYNGWNVASNDDNIGTGSHGTNCAGMIGAIGNNDNGVTGANWNIKIMDIAGYGNPFTEANIIASYDYALNARLLYNQSNGNKGAFVVATSSSWGVDGGDPANYPIWCSFYDDLGEAGILNVGATTNQDQDVDTFGDVPTTCASEYMISVTATNNQDIVDFAGYGDQTIDVAAPGSGIYTTAANNGYTYTSGTSFACPLTAGVIGLMYSIPCFKLESLSRTNPQEAAKRVKKALFDGVDQTAYLQTKTITGGRINSKNALDNIMDATCTLCIPPDSIITVTTSDYSSEIRFNPNSNASSYQINIQVEGSGIWSNYNTTDTNYVFSGLTNCTTYEYTVSSICNGQIGVPSRSYKFKTDGCGNCINLNYCDHQATNNTNAQFQVYSPSSIAGNYTFQATSYFGGNPSNGYVTGELILVNDGTASPNEGCNTLLNATELNGNIAIVDRGNCNFTTKVLNAQNAGAVAVIVVNNVAGTIEMGGNNNSITIPAVMISQSDGLTLKTSINNGDQPEAILGIQNEWIEEFQINGNTFTSGDDNGYRFNENAFSLELNQNIPFVATLGFDGQVLEEKLNIWIDYNQDGTFDNSELVFNQTSAGLSVIGGNFTIPGGATLGKTRMRVQMAYNGTTATGTSGACGIFDQGEVEDYCIEIKSNLNCNINISESINQPVCNELQNGSITLNVTGGTPGYTFTWNNGMTGPTVTNLFPNNYQVTITDATGCDTTLHFPITYVTQLSLSKTITSPTCVNSNDAEISVSASGSTGFTYQWANGPNSNTWSNLTSGTYQITAEDVQGCKITENFTIENPSVIRPIADFTNDNYNLTIEFNNSSQNAIAYLWDFDDGNSSIDFEPTHTYTNEGIYNVCLTAMSSCDTTVTCKAVTVEDLNLSTTNEAMENQLVIYPNPSKDIVTIEKSNKEITHAIIYTTNGKKMMEVSLDSQKTQLKVSNWASGIYIIHFRNNQQRMMATNRVSVIH